MSQKMRGALANSAAAIRSGVASNQEELRRVVRQFLESKSPESAVLRADWRPSRATTQAVWSQMGEQLGLQGLVIPEEFGGSGYSYIELIVVLEEMGRALLCAPYFSSVVLAGQTLLHSGDDAAKKELLPGIASGETIATLAFTEENGRWDEEGITATATKSGDGWAINGTKMFVLDGHTGHDPRCRADRCRCEPLLGRRRRVGPDPHPLSTMDQTRKQAKLEFADTPATLIGTDGAGWTCSSGCSTSPPWRWPPSRSVGRRRCLEMAVQYAKDRVQFGRPIGSFQAIKHKCADMLLEVESAKSAAYYAGWCASELNDELPSVASLAKAYCSEAYFHATAENIQIHGGIGFTWEHPAHLYFKRAKSSELLFGDPTYHRELLAQRIGI